MHENFKMVAKTFYGFEDVLSKELLKLGAQKIEKGSRSVSFYGDKGFLYKANLVVLIKVGSYTKSLIRVRKS